MIRVSPDAVMKGSSEFVASAWRHTSGLHVLTSRCSNNRRLFQFREKFTPSANLNALGRKPVPVYGCGPNVREWLFVEDHVEVLVLTLQKGRVGEVGWYARHRFDAGLRETGHWHLGRADWRRPIRDGRFAGGRLELRGA